MALHLVFCITLLKPNNVFQVFGKSTCSLTSQPFSFPGGNIWRWPFLRKIFWEFMTIFFQLTSVLHASCPARLDLQPLLHPALYEHAAEGTRQFASSLLGEIGICICEVFAQVFVIFSPQYLPRAVLPRLPHAAPRQGRSGIIGSILPFQAIETYCRTTDGVSAPYCDLISSKMLKFKL